MDNTLIPTEWVICKISEIATVNPKKIEADPDVTSGFVPMSHAPTDYAGRLQFDEKPWGEIKKSYTNFQNGDVIFAKVTPCFENGKAAVVEDLPNGIGAGSSEFYVLRADAPYVSEKLIYALIKTHGFATEGAQNMTGAVGLRRVPRKFVEDYAFPLPPLAEQKVIAEKLDKLLAKVDSIKARLDAVPDTLKRFRQSVLAAAVSGKLTKEWRGNSKNISSNYIEWGWTEIPDGWRVEAYCELVESRLGKMLDKSKNTGLPTTYLGNINVRWFEFNLDNVQEILVSESERSELSLQHDDVLICEGGEPGRCAIWKQETNEPIVFQKALHRARVGGKISPTWLVYNLKNDADNLMLSQLFTGTTIKHLTGKALKKYPIRVPSLEEQTEIVRRVEKLFAYADKVEAEVNAAQDRVNKLTQSILAKAFRGELTAKWRELNPEIISGENSAEALLEKIKAEREKLKPKKKARARKKA